MAQAAQDALIQKVINGLVDKIVEECSYIYNYQSNVQNVEDKVAELLSVEGEVDLEVVATKWQSKITGTHIEWWKGEVTKIKGKSDKVLKGANKVNSGCLKGRLNVAQRFLLSRKAAQLILDITKILDEGRNHIKLEHDALPAGLLPASSTTISEDLQSRIDLMNQVMVALGKEEIYMIGICGMPGVGKTRLADEVKRRVLEEKLFDAAVNVDVSQVPNIPDIQAVIAQNLGLKLEEPNEDGRARKLLNRLTDGTKNLVILDNIWEKVPLDKVGLPFQGEQNGCKVVFTSRNTRMLRLMKAQEEVRVETLSEPEARFLFKKIAGEYEEAMANKVADECGGLPLAIDTLASALGGRDLEVWESSLDQLKKSTASKISSMKLVYSRIKLSYDLLKSRHPQAQPLLLLCCLFPEGADIPYQKLVRYAKGLQLPEDFDNLVNTSNRVYELLDDLKNCSLLLRGEKEMSVKMNHVVRKVCLSISSEEDKNRYKVKHQPKLTRWPDKDENQPYTGISLTFDDKMQQLPDGLVYPELALLQLQFNCDSLNMPLHFFNGMKEVRVLDFKRMTLWGKFIQIDTLPPILELLTNLRTLCVEFCDLSARDLSLIGSLKYLEVLSFFSSKLDNLPFQIQQLANLKLLDLRCADGPHFIPSSVLSALTKLEDLYLGNYDSWSRETEQSDKGKGICITELSSLPLLKVLQVRVRDPRLLLELKEEFLFERLRRFQIAAIRKLLSFREYEIGKSMTLDGMVWSSLLGAKISSLLSSTECLTLKSTSFRKLFSVCANLKTLDLEWCGDVSFIMDAEDSPGAMNKLKSMEIRSMDDLEVICNGDLPSKSLIELETVKLDSLPQLTQLWRAPIGSGCLVNLSVLEMSYCEAITSIFPYSVAKGLVQLQKLDIKSCDMLEWIVSKEDGAAEKIVFQKLSFLSLDELPSFRSFFPDSGKKAFNANSVTVEENQLAIGKTTNHKTQGCGWFTRKRRADRAEEAPGAKIFHPALEDSKNEAQFDSEDNNDESTIQHLLNQLVELPSLNKLLVRSMNNLEHIVDDQTSRESVSKLRIMHVDGCEKLLNLASSDSIRILQSLEQVKVKNCESLQAVFDFRSPKVEFQSADPLLSKLETVILLNLKNLKHVWVMVPEGTPCFKNVRSLEISGCCSLNYVFSVSAAKMLGNLQDLKVKGSAMVEEIIELEGGYSEVSDTIQFSHLRVLQLDNLDGLTSFSSRNLDFEFPQLQDLVILECPNMSKFCGGQVTARKLERVRVGDRDDQRIPIKDGLNKTIQYLNGDRVELASAEIVEV